MIPDTSANHGTRMSILCAILQYDPGAAEDNSFITDPRHTVFPVTFQVPSTNEYMTCSSSKITVQSVRWPHTRFTAPERPTLPLLNLLKGSSCIDGVGPNGGCIDRAIDAAVWVMPLCGGGAAPRVCIKSAVDAACFPYCLAVRQTGTYNSMLTLYNQPNWIERVHIFNMDCASHRFYDPSLSNPTSILANKNIKNIASGWAKQGIMNTAAASYIADQHSYGGVTDAIPSAQPTQYSDDQISTIQPSDILGTTLISPYQTPGSAYCVQSNLATSTLPKQFFQSKGVYGETGFRSTLADAQPFVFAGTFHVPHFPSWAYI